VGFVANPHPLTVAGNSAGFKTGLLSPAIKQHLFCVKRGLSPGDFRTRQESKAGASKVPSTTIVDPVMKLRIGARASNSGPDKFGQFAIRPLAIREFIFLAFVGLEELIIEFLS